MNGTQPERMQIMSDKAGLKDKICPICKKLFYVSTNEWTYQNTNHVYFCSWKCYRAMKHDKEKQYTVSKDPQRDAEIYSLYMQGFTFKHICKRFGMPYSTVVSIVQKRIRGSEA